MRCYKCNSVLGESDFCMKCGADVSVYKIVVKSSNTYYNLGLAKAQVRDLTGAIEALRTSVKINKNNIKARNLLGLIYYEMGEIGEALREWVISINLKTEKNVASAYIRKLKANPNKLESYNQAAKKYNYSIDKAGDDGDDVALIQLKKVIQLCPRYVKANLLLALIYMKRQDFNRAGKLLKNVLKTDRNNTLALRYLDEINRTGIAADSDKGEDYYKGKKLQTDASGVTTVISAKREGYKEPGNGILTVIYILIGVVIGVALVWFLIVPSKLQNAQYDNNEKLKEYNEQLAERSIEIDNLETDLAETREELEKVKKELANYNGSDGYLAQYESLISAVYAYLDTNIEQAMVKLTEIDITMLPSDTAKSLYTRVQEACSSGDRAYFTAGLNSYNATDYINAAKLFEEAYSIDSTQADTVYYLAMSYMMLSDEAGAQKYIDIMNENFTTSNYYTLLTTYLQEQTQAD